MVSHPIPLEVSPNLKAVGDLFEVVWLSEDTQPYLELVCHSSAFSVSLWTSS